MRRPIILSIALLTTGTGIAGATPIEFDFSNGGMGSGLGNSIVLTEAGITATLRGFSVDKNGGVFTTSQVTRWSTGAGNCNNTGSEVIANCRSPHHAFDNGGMASQGDNRIDVAYIQFTESSVPVSVLLDSAVISAWSSDFDVSFWVGTGTGPATLAGMTLSGLTDLSLGDVRYDDNFTGSVPFNGFTRPVNFETGHEILTPVSWLVFGAAAFGTSSDGSNDNFKFKLLTVEEQQVPAPGVLYLIGAWALAFAVTRRHKLGLSNRR